MLLAYGRVISVKIMLTIIVTVVILYGVAWLLPWHAGMYGLSGRVHGLAYQVLFSVSLYILITAHFLSTNKVEKYYISILKGLFYGYLASVLSYIYAYGFFYFGYGFERIIILVENDLEGFLFGFFLYPVMLGGWAYGFLLITINRYFLRKLTKRGEV